jgi:hypothetical protein
MKRWLGLVVVGLILVAPHVLAFETQYQGRPLRISSDTGPLTWTCRAEYAANTGYYRGKGWTLTSEYKQQSRPVTWIVTFKNDGAHVTDGQGNVGRYLVTKIDRTGVVLVEAEAGTSVQVTQNAQPLWNRANTFTGTCE